MKLTVNNEPVETGCTNLLDLLHELHISPEGIAVAASRKIIKRDDWHTFGLEEGTDILIIKAVCGG